MDRSCLGLNPYFEPACYPMNIMRQKFLNKVASHRVFATLNPYYRIEGQVTLFLPVPELSRVRPPSQGQQGFRPFYPLRQSPQFVHQHGGGQ